MLFIIKGKEKKKKYYITKIQIKRLENDSLYLLVSDTMVGMKIEKKRERKRKFLRQHLFDASQFNLIRLLK